MKTISLEKEFEDYLRMARLSKRDLDEDQLRALRRAFYGAAGMILVSCSKIYFHGMNGEESLMAMANMLGQIAKFWSNENNYRNN